MDQPEFSPSWTVRTTQAIEETLTVKDAYALWRHLRKLEATLQALGDTAAAKCDQLLTEDGA